MFTKYDDIESTVQSHKDDTVRCTNEVYQEIQDVRGELDKVQADFTENNVLTKHIRKIRKYVNKKCREVHDTAKYSTEGASNEVFSYVDSVRSEIEKRTAQIEADIVELNDTYYRDYQMFIRREDELMERLNKAEMKAEDMCARLEATFMKQLKQHDMELRKQVSMTAGDLREEFARAISNEFEYENTAEQCKNVRDELIDLVTRSNEIHTYRFATVAEDVKQIRENCHTLKQSIGMVDAELSDVKETVEHLTDETGQNTTDISDLFEDVNDMKEDMYRELDRDYYDLKDYVKRRINRHEKKSHIKVDVEVEEQQIQENTPESESQSESQQPTEHVIIIDENTVFSDDE